MVSDRYERVMAAIQLEVPDRVPWGLWGHIPCLQFLRYYSWEKSTRDGEEIARSHLALLQYLDYKMDLLKVTPFFRYMGICWGTKFRFINNDEQQETVDVAVKGAEDWKRLWVLDPKKELKEYLRSVSILSRELGGMPFVYTMGSPLVQALLCVSTPERVYEDMRSQPDALKQGLETIAQTLIDFGRACIDEGAAGVFYAIGSGGNFWSRMNINQLEQFALYYDRKVLLALREAPIRILHICSEKPHEDPQRSHGLMEKGWFKEYPVNAINWWDASFTPLPVAKKIYGDRFCIIGGVDHHQTMRTGTPEQVEDEVKKSIENASEGGGFILGPGCTVHQDTPLENFNAVGRAVYKYGRYDQREQRL